MTKIFLLISPLSFIQTPTFIDLSRLYTKSVKKSRKNIKNSTLCLTIRFKRDNIISDQGGEINELSKDNT
nr:MAG TPA: hypothetical protein [Caudoviricetes sp.]